MSKAFVREDQDDDDEAPERTPTAPTPGGKNYMTPAGFGRLRAELKLLVEVERPALVQTVSWAAKNGDRSENGDYIYGKKRLREIDRRIRFLIKRIENADVVDPRTQSHLDQVFFGATVIVCDEQGVEATYQIVGVDEADATAGRVSWVSPIARALMKGREGDQVRFDSPSGVREVEIVGVSYI